MKMLFAVVKVILPMCFIAAAVLMSGRFSAHAIVQDMPDCNINAGTCTKKIGDAEIILDIIPKPVKAMKELSFTVTLKGKTSAKKSDNLILDLDMPGMYMGKNRVMLEKTVYGKYKGKGVIPRCPSGKKHWRATVYISDTASDNMKADFMFNVLY